MKIVKKITQLSLKEHLLLWEVFFYLLFAKIVLVLYSIKKIAPHLGVINQELKTNLTETQQYKANQIRIYIKRIAKFLPWRSVCIDQAMAGLLLLSKRKISASLCLGVLTDKKQNKLLAHAWVVCGEVILIGGNRSRTFKLVSSFVKNH